MSTQLLSLFAAPVFITCHSRDRRVPCDVRVHCVSANVLLLEQEPKAPERASVCCFDAPIYDDYHREFLRFPFSRDAMTAVSGTGFSHLHRDLSDGPSGSLASTRLSWIWGVRSPCLNISRT